MINISLRIPMLQFCASVLKRKLVTVQEKISGNFSVKYIYSVDFLLQNSIQTWQASKFINICNKTAQSTEWLTLGLSIPLCH